MNVIYLYIILKNSYVENCNYNSNFKHLKRSQDVDFAWNSVVNLINHSGSISVIIQFHFCLSP